MAAVIASTVDASTPVACRHVSYWVCGCGQVISYRGGWRDQLIVVVVITRQHPTSRSRMPGSDIELLLSRSAPAAGTASTHIAIAHVY